LSLAQHAKRVYYYSLYPASDRRMAAGLHQAVLNGARVGLMTNSAESSHVLSKIPIPYDGGVTSMLALAEAGVSVYQWIPRPDLLFMHQKLAVVDDTVIFGSHNFNYSSTHGGDETDILIHDPALADWFAAQFDTLAATHARLATPEFLRAQRKRRIVDVEFSKLFLGLY
jgi:phosphatidylserine/phosphatidylglycerophosphate/cardiolipin synthase-like enzyme